MKTVIASLKATHGVKKEKLNKLQQEIEALQGKIDEEQVDLKEIGNAIELLESILARNSQFGGV